MSSFRSVNSFHIGAHLRKCRNGFYLVRTILHIYSLVDSLPENECLIGFTYDTDNAVVFGREVFLKRLQDEHNAYMDREGL